MARPTNPRPKAEAQPETEIEVQESVEVPDEAPVATDFVAEEAPEEEPKEEKKDKPNPVPGARRSAVAPQKKIKVLRTGLMLNGRILRKGDEVFASEALFSQDDEAQVASYGEVYFEVAE